MNWCRRVLVELDLTPHGSTVVNQDNLGTIAWTSEVQGLRNVKHVGIRYAFVKEAVEAQSIKVLYTPSHKNKADAVTKTLVGSAFNIQREMIHVIPKSARGGVPE